MIHCIWNMRKMEIKPSPWGRKKGNGSIGRWKTSICPALRGIIRPPHPLGGVARSRSLFVATPPLILALLDEKGWLLERDSTYYWNWWMRSSTRVLSNRASRCSVHSSTPHSSGFRAPPKTGFRRTQLASACLRIAASAEAGVFLISLKKWVFQQVL